MTALQITHFPVQPDLAEVTSEAEAAAIRQRESAHATHIAAQVSSQAEEKKELASLKVEQARASLQSAEAVKVAVRSAAVSTLSRQSSNLFRERTDLIRQQEDARERKALDGSNVKAVIFWGASATCAAAECGVTFVTMPWLLNISTDSALAVLLSALPVAALYVLKEGFEQQLRPAFVARGRVKTRPAGRVVTETVLLYVMGIAATVTLAQIVGARELSRKLSHAVAEGLAIEPTAAQESTIFYTVLAVTLFGVIAGAACAAYGNLYRWGSKHIRAAARELQALDAKICDLEAKLAESNSQLDLAKAGATVCLTEKADGDVQNAQKALDEALHQLAVAEAEAKTAPVEAESHCTVYRATQEIALARQLAMTASASVVAAPPPSLSPAPPTPPPTFASVQAELAALRQRRMHQARGEQAH